MEDMGLKIIAGIELIPPGLYFVLMQNAAKDGNAQDCEHSLTAHTGIQKDPKPQWARDLLNQGFPYLCLVNPHPALEVTVGTPIDVSNTSVCQLRGSVRESTLCGGMKQLQGCLGPTPAFTRSQKSKGSILCFFLLQGFQ